MKSPLILRHLALAALATVAGCSTLEVKQPTVQQTAEIRKGPEDRPQRSITGFSQALRSSVAARMIPGNSRWLLLTATFPFP